MYKFIKHLFGIKDRLIKWKQYQTGYWQGIYNEYKFNIVRYHELGIWDPNVSYNVYVYIKTDKPWGWDPVIDDPTDYKSLNEVKRKSEIFLRNTLNLK